MYVSTNDSVAKVVSDKGEYSYVQFLSSCQKSFKGAKVYSFENSTEIVTHDNITTRHDTMTSLGFKQVQDNMFVEIEEIDEDSSSDIESDYDYSESGSEDSFIVPDDEEVLIKPVDHREVDAKWNSWRPISAGARRFKDKVDQIEEYMNYAIDEKFVFKK